MENVQHIQTGRRVGYLDLVASIIHFCYVVVDLSVFFKDINTNIRTGMAIFKIIALVGGVWLSYMLIESTQKDSIKNANRYAQIWVSGKTSIVAFFLIIIIRFFANGRPIYQKELKEFRYPAEAVSTIVLTITFICLAYPYIKELMELRKLEKDRK
ncbi:hypothetical protein Ocin01_07424 [Orchesella cincta]|uniref:Transmembrane protein n=1 Tax=Orchesella cincta TaxID=48709 RepID=A0A1D2N1U9_ORCCI|nr:hypothetical protein Ocin01_07424 [Orchesella cincta]